MSARWLLAAAALHLSACTAQADPRPSVLVIVLDDFTASMTTPRLAAIAAEGMRFDNTIVESPLCAPTRAGILTGRHTHNHLVRGNVGGNAAWQANGNGKTIADWFSAAGFTTIRAGKWINGVQRSGQLGWSYDIRAVRASGDPGGVGSLTQQAVELIEATTTPLLVYLAPDHDWNNPSPEYAGSCEAMVPPRDPSFDAPVENQRWKAMPPLTDEQIAAIDSRYRHARESMESIVDAIQAMRAAFGDRPLYVVVTSDGGHEDGQHRYPSGKGKSFEESIRVPMFILGPGIEPGRSSALVQPIDVAPTLGALAGVDVPELDGRSLVPLLVDPATTWRKRALLEHGFRGVRTARRKLVLKGDKREFYNLRSDPYELANRCLPIDPTCGAELEAFLPAMLGCHGASCWNAEGGPQ